MAAQLLNLDLDFFIEGIAHWRSSAAKRLSARDHPPWSAAQVRSFLEDQCGLSRARKIPGRQAVHHDAAFDYIGAVYDETQKPMVLTHVDAHADQGLGDGGWVYLTFDLLHRPIEERRHPERGPRAMNFANYLAFAVGCRWIERIDMVCHPKGGDDFMPYHFRGFRSFSNVIELKAFDPAWEDKLMDVEKAPVIAYEPPVPFRPITLRDYKATEKFTHGFLAQSPGFTPKSADVLIDVIADYIDFK